MKRFILALGLCWAIGSVGVEAVAPQGSVDVANETVVAGWASDGDVTGPIKVHIYVDEMIVAEVVAGENRADVGAHAFNWYHPTFGVGTHTVKAYAIGVNSGGGVDGQNVQMWNSPKQVVNQNEFTLVSPNGQVSVTADGLYGGSITKIFDLGNMPEVNMVQNAHGGAMLQNAFWINPRHATVPFNCDPRRDDMWYTNPTQGGFYGGVIPTDPAMRSGNPIGIMGNDVRKSDPQEFMKFEDEGRVIHLKTKLIRHDYCRDRKALGEYQGEWDTDFYLEQWLSFESGLPATLKTKSKLINAGTQQLGMRTRQIPINFAKKVPRVAYVKNGSTVVLENSCTGACDTPANQTLKLFTEKRWAALLSIGKTAGVGMVVSPLATNTNGTFSFSYNGKSDWPTALMWPFDDGLSKLTTYGKVDKVVMDAGDNNIWQFSPGGTFEWNVYYPIGGLGAIETASATLLADPIKYFDYCQKKINGDANCDNGVNMVDFGTWKTEYVSGVGKSADFDESGRVGLTDFGAWKRGFLGI